MLLDFVVAYVLCGCLLGILAEIMDGTGRDASLWETIESVAFVVLAWPGILWAIYQRECS